MLHLLQLFACLVAAMTAQAASPNIIFIVADDMGYNDVGYNNHFMVTPNLDSLARDGVILDKSYMQPVCTPSRSSFLTGQYPFKTGMQQGTLDNNQPECLPLDLNLLPQELKKLGYSTHLIGKWHLGFCNQQCLPNSRGFDSFYGFYGGASDHYTHMTKKSLDLRDNVKPDTSESGTYSTHLFTKKAIDRIESHDGKSPLFIDLSYSAPHSPIQVPASYEAFYTNVTNNNRRKYMAMVTALDEGIGKVVNALKRKGFYDNSVIVFTSDNGGNPTAGASNYPLRGSKGQLYEGGTHVPAFVHSPLMKKTNYRHQGMIHAVDWFTTILSMAGGKTDGSLDGVDQSAMITTGSDSKRTEIVYNVSPSDRTPFTYSGAIRVGDYKLIIGRTRGKSGWYPGSEQEGVKTEEPPGRTLQRQLFNLKDDPYERRNLINGNSAMFRQLKTKLDAYFGDSVDPIDPGTDGKSDPSNFNNVWSTGWC